MSGERIVGWLLLLTGTALVVSISWAAIGFLSLGLGLIFLQIAEHKRKMRRPSSSLDAASQQRSLEPGNPSKDEAIAAHDERPRVERKLSLDSQQVWSTLAELDPQILRLADALTPFGQRYVDQLAAACFAAGEATQFPEIARKIVALALAEQDQVGRATNDGPSSQDNEQRQSPSVKVALDGTDETKIQAIPLPSSVAASRPLRSEPPVEQQPQDPADATIAKAVPIVADNRAAGDEISGQADPATEAANATGKKLQNGLTDDDDLKNMAQILARLNEVLATKPDA